MFVLPILKPLLLTGLLLMGLLHGLMLAVSPFAQQHQDEIEAVLARELGTDIGIGALKTRWRGFGPALILHDVRIGDASDSITLRHAVVDLHLPGLLAGETFGALRFGLTGLKLRLIREADGRLRLAGLPVADPDASNSGGLPAHVRLLQTELLFEDRKVGRPPIRLAPVHVTLDREGDTTTLRGTLDSEFGRLSVAAAIAGDPTGLDWRGAIRVIADDVAVAPLVAGYTPRHFQLQSLTLNGELASLWEHALPVQVTGQLELDELRLSGLSPTEPPISLPHLKTGLIRFRREGDDYRLALDGIEFTGQDGAWPDTTLQLQLLRTEPLRLRLATDFVRLQDLVQLLRIRAPWAGLGDALALAPRGDLRDLRIDLSLGADGLDWQASTTFDRIGLSRHGDIPGLSNLSGHLKGHADHIQAALDGEDIQLDFGPLFQAPLQIDRLTGLVDWVVGDEDSWRLSSEALGIKTPHFSSRSRFALQLHDDTPVIDLQTELGPLRVTDIGPYLPRPVMRDRLEQWLAEGLVSGTVGRSDILVAGPLTGFPFDQKHDGRMLAVLAGEDLTVEYHPDWPRMEQVWASVRFHNNDLEVRIDRGRIYDSDIIAGTELRIPQLDPAMPVELKGGLRGPLADDLRVLAESPLKKDFANFVRDLRASGMATLRLDLAVPIDDLGEYRLDGRLEFENAGLYLESWQLPISAIHGSLAIGLDAVSGQDLSAVALDSPVSVDVVPEPDGATRIDVSGALGIERVQRQLPWLPLTHIASGHSAFDVAIRIPGLDQADQPTMLLVDSALEGITLDLPDPLAKAAADNAAISIEVPLDGGLPFRLRYRDRLDAVLDGDLSRGEIVLGGGQAQYPEAGQLRVRGEIGRLDPIAWAGFFTALPSGTAAGARAPLDLELHCERLELGTLEFAQANLELTEAAGHWQGQVRSATLSGSFILPFDFTSAPARFELDHLDLPLASDTETPAASVADPAELDPRDWPGFTLTSQAFLIDGRGLGTLGIRAYRHDDGLHFESIRIAGGKHEFHIGGDWRYSGAGPRSSFSGHVETASMGELLPYFGFDPNIERAPAVIDFDLSWTGDPADIIERRVDGELGLDIGAGSFVEIDPGVARVAGLLNFNGLIRRLRLDFADLLGKGYAFDSINGSFRLGQGNAHTDDLQIKGPSGLVQVQGRTGLLDRDFDQHVTVNPKLDATLPIAGTLAGGPIGGAVALVAQQIFSDQVAEINRFQYSVSGSWDQPVVTQLNTGGTLSKLFRPLSGEPDAATSLPDDEGETDGFNDLPEISPEDGDALDQSSEFEAIWENLSPSAAGRPEQTQASEDNILQRFWQQLRQAPEPGIDAEIIEE